LIVAGGKGERMGSETPKQFIALAGKPILLHTLEAFLRYDADLQLILVLHPELFIDWENIRKDYGMARQPMLVEGGKERYHSVRNGLSLVEDHALVAIHDAVRPLVSKALISEAYSRAATYGSAVPVTPLNETIRKISGSDSEVVDRNRLFSVQTPQAFQAELIKKAYSQDYRPAFTDDASLLEAMGEKVHFFPGEITNIKITRPEDLALAEKLLQSKPSS